MHEEGVATHDRRAWTLFTLGDPSSSAIRLPTPATYELITSGSTEPSDTGPTDPYLTANLRKLAHICLEFNTFDEGAVKKSLRADASWLRADAIRQCYKSMWNFITVAYGNKFIHIRYMRCDMTQM